MIKKKIKCIHLMLTVGLLFLTKKNENRLTKCILFGLGTKSYLHTSQVCTRIYVILLSRRT